MNARKDLVRYGFADGAVGGLWLKPEEVFEFIDKLQKEAFQAGWLAGINNTEIIFCKGPSESKDIKECYQDYLNGEYIIE